MNNYEYNFVNHLVIEFGGQEYNVEIPSTEKNIAFLKFLENEEVSRPFLNDLDINYFITKQLKKLFSNEINCAVFSTSVISFLSSHIEKSLKTVLENVKSDSIWNNIIMY